jgi:hypothetical protein
LFLYTAVADSSTVPNVGPGTKEGGVGGGGRGVGGGRRIWIAKSSAGGKGEGICVSDSVTDVLEHIDKSSSDSAWVVSRLNIKN